MENKHGELEIKLEEPEQQRIKTTETVIQITKTATKTISTVNNLHMLVLE